MLVIPAVTPAKAGEAGIQFYLCNKKDMSGYRLSPV